MREDDWLTIGLAIAVWALLLGTETGREIVKAIFGFYGQFY